MCRCLLTKCYSAAVPVLSEEVSEVDPSRTALTATDFLLYCYYGARIHIGESLLMVWKEYLIGLGHPRRAGQQ